MAGQTWPWVGLTHGLGWVGSSSVKCELLPNSTGKYHFQSRILFNIHHSERDFSAVSRTITDARSRLSAKTVEAMELIRWAVRGSLLNMDD